MATKKAPVKAAAKSKVKAVAKPKARAAARKAGGKKASGTETPAI
jgi:hypothetical protein